MEDKVIQHSFIFKISDKMTAQIKKPVTHKERKVWQVKEMEVVYGYETSSDFRSNENNNK